MAHDRLHYNRWETRIYMGIKSVSVYNDKPLHSKNYSKQNSVKYEFLNKTKRNF